MSCPLGHRAPASADADATAADAADKAPIHTAQPPHRGNKPVYYHEYLQLDKVLGAQRPMSLEVGHELAHEEMLFIVIHQNYELWFKQILHDLDSIRDIFALPKLPERATGIIARRLERVVKIQTLLVGQMSILETMTPLDFLDFRDYLFPASGFQSVQFRLLENSLGLLRERRMKYSRADYDAPLSEAHRALVAESERRPSLFALVEKWLERTPFVESKDFDFWAAYKESAHQFFASERQLISNNAELAAEERAQRLRDWEANEKNFLSIFDEEDFKQQIAKGTRRLSYGATKAAIMINLYGDEPAFQLPQRIIESMIEIDQQLTAWRYRHASMVNRMIGAKMGTGGSSGFAYLKATASHHRIFDDFFNLSMFLLPRSVRPKLPANVQAKVRFFYESER